ncbi:hypothetical protein PYCC9005_005055 [Savitreella phatthalungensis]
MVSATRDLDAHSYADVESQEPEIQLAALRQLKTDVIGHVERKQYAIDAGVIPRLLAVCAGQPQGRSENTAASSNASSTANAANEAQAAQVEAVVVLAALCGGDATPAMLQQRGLVSQLNMVQILGSLAANSDISSPLRLPCLRCLVQIVQTQEDSANLWAFLSQGSWCVEVLTRALATPKPVLISQATLIAQLFATLDESTDVDENFTEQLFRLFVDLVMSVTQSGRRRTGFTAMHVKLLEACLGAITAAIQDWSYLSELIMEGDSPETRSTIEDAPGATLDADKVDEHPFVGALVGLIRSDSSPVRLAAAAALSNLCRNGCIPERFKRDMVLVVLPIVVRLFDEADEMPGKAPRILTDLIADSDEMQKAACEAGAVKRLASILTPGTADVSPTTKEAALLAIAAVSLFKDDYRRQVVDAKCVPLIIAATRHEAPSVRAAACQCIRSLSRSVSMLRTALIDAGVGPAIFALLNDTDVNVQTAAAAAVCNIVLDFSPMRKLLIDQQIIPILVRLASAPALLTHAELQLNALWALKHIVYSAEADIKERVLDEMTPSRLLMLCIDGAAAASSSTETGSSTGSMTSSWAAAEQAMEILRNIACGRPENVDLLVSRCGVDALTQTLCAGLASDRLELVTSAMYTLVNVAAGGEDHRDLIMRQPRLLELLHARLPPNAISSSTDVRLAAVWILINLTWHDDESRAHDRRLRIARLAELGILHTLSLLQQDPSLDLRERVRTVLAQVESA